MVEVVNGIKDRVHDVHSIMLSKQGQSQRALHQWHIRVRVIPFSIDKTKGHYCAINIEQDSTLGC